MKLNKSAWYKNKLGLMMAKAAKLTIAYSCGNALVTWLRCLTDKLSYNEVHVDM